MCQFPFQKPTTARLSQARVSIWEPRSPMWMVGIQILLKQGFGFLVFPYLKELQKEGGRKEKVRMSICWFISLMVTTARLYQAKAKSSEILLGLYVGIVAQAHGSSSASFLDTGN